MRGKFAFPFFLAALLSGSATYAGMVGDKVHGNITIGREDGGDTGVLDTWGTATIGRGPEFNIGRSYRANFKDNRLFVRDKERPRETTTGWQMTFKLIDPEAFKSVSLLRSNFGKGLTYSLSNDVLTIDWAGDAKYLAMTERERRELHLKRFRAVFEIATDDDAVAVPEPGTLALLGGALLAVFAFGRRRKAASQSSRLIG